MQKSETITAQEHALLMQLPNLASDSEVAGYLLSQSKSQQPK
jgi:hypothetical protein